VPINSVTVPVLVAAALEVVLDDAAAEDVALVELEELEELLPQAAMTIAATAVSSTAAASLMCFLT
jgi:hypothetical protein